MLYAGFRAHVERKSRTYPRVDVGGAIPPMSLGRYDLLLAYLFALTPPLHLSAMVAAPAAIALATVDRDLRIDAARAAILIAAAVLATGVGTGSVPIAAAGLVLLSVVGARDTASVRRLPRRRRDRRGHCGWRVQLPLPSASRSTRPVHQPGRSRDARRRHRGHLASPVRRPRPLAAPRAALASDRESHPVRRLAVCPRARSVGRRLTPPDAADGGVRGVRRRRERVAPAARLPNLGSTADSRGVRHTRRGVLPQPQGGAVIRLRRAAAQRGPRGAGTRLFLRARIRRIWSLDRDGCGRSRTPNRATERASTSRDRCRAIGRSAPVSAQLAGGRSTPGTSGDAAWRVCSSHAGVGTTTRGAVRGGRQRHLPALVRAGGGARPAGCHRRDRPADTCRVVSCRAGPSTRALCSCRHCTVEGNATRARVHCQTV